MIGREAWEEAKEAVNEIEEAVEYCSMLIGPGYTKEYLKVLVKELTQEEKRFITAENYLKNKEVKRWQK